MPGWLFRYQLVMQLQLQQPSLHRIHDRRARVDILVFAPLLSLVVLWTWLRRPPSFPLPQFVVAGNDGTTPEHLLVSDGADGAANGHTKDVKLTSLSTTMDDILVVLKTGVTESLSKVPVHLETTLSAIPHFVVVSDYEEEIAGVKTQDVLRRVHDSVKRTIPEFELYNRIQELGREALTHADYGDDSNGPFGRRNNPGWRLDKWKFLPMIPAALDYKPDANWYVFMEADSYIFWPNLVSWLSLLDHTEDYYLGYPMQIGETIFAYGGSGFVISNSVMRKMAQYLNEKLHEPSDINDYTATQWAGDCVLGKVFGDAGVGLNWSWPMLQDNKPWDVDSFAVVNDHRAWCYPVVSYHHMQPDDIRDMWEFDQEWFQTQNSSLLYNDVFHRLVLPKISSQHEDWDNAAENLITSQDGSFVELGFDECSDVCLHDPNCLSYRVVKKDKSCFVSSAVKRGSASAGVKSNWMMDRIHAKIKAYGATCAKVDFVL